MNNEGKNRFWQSVQLRLRQEADTKDEFPPFLHRRIMAAVREEAELSSQPKWFIFSRMRLAIAGGFLGLFLFFTLMPDSVQNQRVETNLIGEVIVTASHGDQQLSNLLSDKALNQFLTQPYKDQLDSIANEFENALDFTIKMMPMEIASN